MRIGADALDSDAHGLRDAEPGTVGRQDFCFESLCHSQAQAVAQA